MTEDKKTEARSASTAPDVPVSAAMMAEMVTDAVDAAMKAQAPAQNGRNTDFVPFIQENLLPEVATHLVQALARPEKLDTPLGTFPGEVETRGSGDKAFEVTKYDCPFETRLVAAPGKKGGRADGSDIPPQVSLEVKLSNSIFGGFVRVMNFKPSGSIQGLTAMYQNGERRRG